MDVALTLIAHQHNAVAQKRPQISREEVEISFPDGIFSSECDTEHDGGNGKE